MADGLSIWSTISRRSPFGAGLAYLLVKIPPYPLLREEWLFHGLKFIGLLGGLVVAFEYVSRREARKLSRTSYSFAGMVVGLLTIAVIWYNGVRLDAENHGLETYATFIAIAFLTGMLFVLAVPVIIDSIRSGWDK